MQRKRYWWLPYVVLEFDKNEILIDALGGDLSSPVWNYRADLCVSERPITFPTCAYCCHSPAMYHVLPTYLSRRT